MSIRADIARGRAILTSNAIKWSALAIAAIAAFFVVSVALLVFTSAGRGFLLSEFLEIAEEAAGQNISIGAVGGSFPNSIEILDVTVSDTRSVWLTADKIHIDLKPASLLRGQVHIASTEINALKVERLPLSGGDESAGKITFPTRANIYDALSFITVERLSLNSLLLEQPVLGQRTLVRAQGSLTQIQSANTAELRLELQRIDRNDETSIVLRSSNASATVHIQGGVAGFGIEGDLSIARRESLSGAVNIRCQDTPCYTWNNGHIEDGNISLGLDGASSTPRITGSFGVTGIVGGGRQLPQFQGEFTLEQKEDGSALVDGNGLVRGVHHAVPEISDVAGDTGDWRVKLVLTDGSAEFQNVQLQLADVTLSASGYAEPGGIGPANISVAIKGGGRLVNVPADTSNFRMTFNADQINSLSDFSGLLNVQLSGAPAAEPLFDGALSAQARVVGVGDKIQVDEISVKSSTVALSGNSEWEVKSGEVNHTSTMLQANIPAAKFAELLPETITANVELRGPVSNLRATAGANVPYIELGELSLSDIRADVQLEQSGEYWRGQIHSTGMWLGSPFNQAADGIAINENGISIDNISFASDAGNLNAQLALDYKGALDGDAKGNVGDLLPLTSALGFPIKGAASFDAKLISEGKSQSANVNFLSKRMTAMGATVDDVSSFVKFIDVFGQQKFDGTLEATSIVVANRTLEAVHASVAGNFSEFDVTVSSKSSDNQRSSLSAAAQIALSKKTEIELEKFAFDDRLYDVQLREPARLSISNTETVLESARATFAGGIIEANLQWDKTSNTVSGRANVQNVIASKILGEFQDELPGTLSGEIVMSGLAESATVDISASAHFPAPVGTGAPPVDIEFQASVDNGQANFAGRGSGLSETPGTFSAQIPMLINVAEGRLVVDVDAPARGQVDWAGDLYALWRLLPVDNHLLAGQAVLEGSFSGTLANPQITGGLQVLDGEYEYYPGGTIVTNMDLEILAENADVFVFSLTASDADNGNLSGKGSISRSSGQSDWIADISADLDRFGLVNRDDVSVSTSGTVSYTGAFLSGTIQGELQVVRSIVRLDASYAPEVPLLREPPANGAAPTPSQTAKREPIKLNVILSIDDQLRAEGRGLESVWRGRIRVGGDILQPDIAGSISLDRGTFSFIGQTFTLDSGTVTFTGGGRVDPQLGITAIRETEDITATVFISGRASDPQITLSSRPPLPQDEVLSRLLFRKGSGQLGPLESVQLASAAADLSGLSEGGLNGLLRRTFGLDVISIGGDEGDSLVVGEQIGRNIYLAIEQNLTDNSRKFIVEWRLTPSISLQSTTSDETGADFGVLWRRDY